MRAGVWVVASLAGFVLVAAGVEARRVVKVSPQCPPEEAEMALDYEGIRDRCVAREPVTCKPGSTLVTDRAGKEDRCTSSDGVAEKPSCPRDRQWKAKSEADECVATASPVCPRGFRLEERPGEDACTY